MKTKLLALVIGVCSLFLFSSFAQALTAQDLPENSERIIRDYHYNDGGTLIGQQVNIHSHYVDANGNHTYTNTSQTFAVIGGSVQLTRIDTDSKSYNPAGELTSETTRWVKYDYDDAGHLSGASGQSVTDAYTYGENGEVVEQAHTVSDLNYTIQGGEALLTSVDSTTKVYKMGDEDGNAYDDRTYTDADGNTYDIGEDETGLYYVDENDEKVYVDEDQVEDYSTAEGETASLNTGDTLNGLMLSSTTVTHTEYTYTFTGGTWKKATESSSSTTTREEMYDSDGDGNVDTKLSSTETYSISYSYDSGYLTGAEFTGGSTSGIKFVDGIGYTEYTGTLDLSASYINVENGVVKDKHMEFEITIGDVVDPIEGIYMNDADFLEFSETIQNDQGWTDAIAALETELGRELTADERERLLQDIYVAVVCGDVDVNSGTVTLTVGEGDEAVEIDLSVEQSSQASANGRDNDDVAPVLNIGGNDYELTTYYDYYFGDLPFGGNHTDLTDENHGEYDYGWSQALENRASPTVTGMVLDDDQFAVDVWTGVGDLNNIHVSSSWWNNVASEEQKQQVRDSLPEGGEIVFEDEAITIALDISSPNLTDAELDAIIAGSGNITLHGTTLDGLIGDDYALQVLGIGIWAYEPYHPFDTIV